MLGERVSFHCLCVKALVRQRRGEFFGGFFAAAAGSLSLDH